jgi:hypothetical protein
MTMGIYTDADCLAPSHKVRYGDYLAQTAGVYSDYDAADTTSLLSEWQS